MGSLRMPENLKQLLSSDEFGILLNGAPEDNALEIKRLIATQRPKKVVVVGDFTLKTLLDRGIAPDLGIFDRRTKRLPYDFPNVETWSVCNPSGHISDEAVSMMKKALSKERKKGVMLYVKGEEDLLSLPAVLSAPAGSFVIYGMPNRGMMLIVVNKAVKEKIASVISQFERSD